jgi:sugar phosphate isomerase/epimerase
VTEVGNPNGVLLLDIWHAYRGGTPYATLPALVPEVVVDVELDNGLAEMVGTDLEDTIDNRLPCGEGIFDVPEFINAVLAIGWDGPWGIEQMSGDFRCLPVRDALTGVMPCCAGSPPERPTSTGRLGSFRRGSE